MPSDPSLYVDMPFTDAILRLTPRWGELGPAAQAIGLTLAVLVPLGLVLWLYRYELRLVKRPVALTLLSLRFCVLLFLWFILCLQPVLTTSATRETPTRVALALDVSGSMNATDPQRPAVDKLRLARALRLTLPGDESTVKMLDGWIEHFRKNTATENNIAWVADDELPHDRDGRYKLAEKRKALYRQVCAEVDGLTRFEIGLQLLAKDGGRLLKNISDKHQVDLVGFSGKTWDLTPEKLEKILEALTALKPRSRGKALELKPEQTVRICGLTVKGLEELKAKVDEIAGTHKEAGWHLQAADLDAALRKIETAGKLVEDQGVKPAKEPGAGDAEITDLALPLERGLKPAGKTQGRLVGIVLLSDGRHNAPSSPARTAERLGKRNVPIYPVVLGTATPRPTVSITDVQAPPNASAENANVAIRVRFKVAGLSRQDILVTLDRTDVREGLPRIPPLVIAHDGADQYYDKSFVVAMDPEGKPRQGFVVTVKPAMKPLTGNMTQQVVIKIDDAKPKVLVVDGEGRWEYHYLSTALARDPSLELQRVLFDPPLRRPGISERDLVKMGNPQRKLPDGADALADYQCIVLGDVAPELLPLEDRRRLEQFVAKHGGTLVIVAGKRFTPLAYQQAARGQGTGGKKAGAKDDTDPLLKLLPIEEMKVVSPEQGFAVTLTREGKAAPFMRMEADAAESERRWAALPPHYWGVIGKAKPAATSLAYFSRPGKVSNDDLLKLSREQALIARHNYGRGQVLFVGLDSTWRWRFRVGDTYHHRFWGQVIRWAAADYVRFGTDKPVYQEGQDVNVSLTLEEQEVRGTVADGELKTRIVREAAPGQQEKMVAVIPLAGGDGMRVLKGRIRSLPAGQYRIEMVPPDPSLNLKLGSKASSTFVVTPRDNKEMDRLETDEDQLRTLARESGTHHPLFTPASADEIVSLLTKRAITVTERYERGLWQEWATLVFFLVLMTAEWIGRKWAGLP
jgi:hypothetical protein